MYSDIAAVVIGRNEGPRLAACLASLRGVTRLVYVNSGSTDNSLQIASAAGADVVELDTDVPFTAARARNAGLHALTDLPEFVQFVDGDCTVHPHWLGTARSFMKQHPKAAVVCGRRRERFPDASVFNRLCDAEWDTPVGQARACGGDALMRTTPLLAAGGFLEDLIAGEEPELCLRLRRAGGEVWRIEAEMTWHDAAMTSLGQWARRAKRAGHAFAEGAFLHGATPERHWVAETRRALFWGALFPATILCSAAVWPLATLLFLVYPLQVLRLSRRLGWIGAAFSVIGKFPEALGAVSFFLGRLRGRSAAIIEYK